MEFKAKGNNLYSQGKVQESVEAYTKGIDLVEEQGEGTTEEDMGCVHLLYSNRSMAQLELCNVDEALQDAELCIEANPEYGKAYARRAAVMVDLWNFKEALQDLDKAEELDPSLAGSLSELRLRATGKKWVHNCYLKQQMELRKKHKCDYVLMLEFEGEDIVEPICFPPVLSGTHALAMPGTAAFNTLTRTGSGVVGGHDMTHAFYFLLVDHLAKIRARVNDTPVYMKMIGEQLIREFGPNEGFSVTRIAQFALQNPEKRKDYYIAQSVQTAVELGGVLKMTTQSIDLCPPLLFPGSPKWMQWGLNELALQTKFLEEVRTHFKELTGFIQVHLDALVLMIGTTQARYFKADRENKCHGCGIAISDPDPQECICGHMYCSSFCHTDNILSHAGECEKIMQTLGDSHNLYVMFTGLYWQRVYDGVFPCKGEPDAVALWKERKMPDDDSIIGRKNEADFLFKIESAAFTEDITQARLAARSPDQLPDPRMSQVLGQQTLTRWFHAMGTPLDTDSLPRLQAKAMMAMKVDLFWREYTPSLTAKQHDDLTPLNEGMRKLTAHLLERVNAKQLYANLYVNWMQKAYADHCADRSKK